MIGAAPSGELSLESDTRLIKAALLYSDRATLCSPQAIMILSACAIGEFTGDQQIEFIEKIAPTLMQDPEEPARIQTGLRSIRQLAHKKGKSRQEVIALAAARERLRHQWKNIRASTQQMAHGAGVDGLATALESGLLDVHPIGLEGDIETLVTNFVDFLRQAVTSGETYPLFDATSGNLIDAMAREGELDLSESAKARARHPQLAAHLFQRLPLFEAASVRDVLQIRRELNAPLVRFRAAVMRFSDMIRSAAWDQEFVHDAEEVVHKEIAPAILDIEEEVRSNSFLARLIYKIGEKPLSAPAGSAIGIGLTKLSEVPELSGYGLGLGAGAVLAFTAADAHREWDERKRATERNHLYFYYPASRKTGDGKP